MGAEIHLAILWILGKLKGNVLSIKIGTMKELFDILAVSGKHGEGFTLRERAIGFAVVAGLVVIAFAANF